MLSYFLLRSLKEGRRVVSSSDFCEDFKNIEVMFGRKKVSSMDVCRSIPIVSAKTKADMYQALEHLAELRDCDYFDGEMWKFFGTTNSDPKIKHAFRHFFSIARHNGVRLWIAGQDETQISFEFRRDFDKIVSVRKMQAVHLWKLPLIPMGIEVRVYGKSDMNSSNRFDPKHARQVMRYYPKDTVYKVFDTHAERRQESLHSDNFSGVDTGLTPDVTIG